MAPATRATVTRNGTVNELPEDFISHLVPGKDRDGDLDLPVVVNDFLYSLSVN